MGTWTSPAVIFRVDMASKILTGAVRLNTNENHVKAMVLDDEAGILYVTTFSSPPTIVRIRTLDFMRIDSFTAAGARSISSGVFVPRHEAVFFATYSSPATIIKLSTSSNKIEKTVTLGEGQDNAYSLVYDDTTDKLLLATFTSPARLVRIQLPELAIEDEVVFSEFAALTSISAAAWTV